LPIKMMIVIVMACKSHLKLIRVISFSSTLYPYFAEF
jgi:hypothetical protein